MSIEATLHQAKQRQLKHLYRAICDVLFREWDPLTANLVSSDADEYAFCAPRIYRLIQEKVSAEQIADYLETVQRSDLGLDVVDKELNLKIAQKLLELVNKT